MFVWSSEPPPPEIRAARHFVIRSTAVGGGDLMEMCGSGGQGLQQVAPVS